MNRYVYCALLACLIVVGITVQAWTAGRGIVPVAIKDQSGKQVGLYKESHALVIGVSEYGKGWPKLPGVLEDVREVKGVLEAQGFNVVLALNPDRRQMADAFDSFINKYGRGKDNRLLFYFAGHGHTLKTGYGADMGYVVPIGTPDPSRDEAGFLANAISMNQMEVYARNIHSKHAVFIFDSCFSGALFALTRAIPQVIQEKTALPVRQFITAGTAEQTVPDESLFRRMFVKALRGEGDLNHDGYVTVTELGQYLEDTVTNYSKSSQTPKYGKIRDMILDQGDFVFPLKAAKTLPDVQAEMKNVEAERLLLAEERKTVEAQKKLSEEKQKLEAEREKLAQEREQMASLEASKAEEKRKASGPAGMVKVPGGEYMAGLDPDLALAECRKYWKAVYAPAGGDCKRKWYANSGFQQKVVLSFHMDKHEVTQAEFERVMGSNPSYFKGSNLPVESVTWNEADEYCRKVGKRLPTEWEWEKAAKGGRDTIYPWGNEMESGKANICDRNCEFGWKAGQFDDGYKYTSPVGSYAPNGYGLYDMVGNVWEWTASKYDDQAIVLRGGSSHSDPHSSRPARRFNNEPSLRFIGIGFRCSQ